MAFTTFKNCYSAFASQEERLSGKSFTTRRNAFFPTVGKINHLVSSVTHNHELGIEMFTTFGFELRIASRKYSIFWPLEILADHQIELAIVRSIESSEELDYG